MNIAEKIKGLFEKKEKKAQSGSRPEIVKKIEKLYEKYEDVVEFSDIKLPAKLLLFLTAVGMIAGFVIGSLLDITLAILISLTVFDIGVFLPFYLKEKKIDQIESRLPDVLHHIGTTLKTGGTIEVALREVTRIDYGPITDGLKNMLREINEGKTFEDAFNYLATTSYSPLLKKCAIIIIAARKAGGGLLETLVAMAEDIRQYYRVKRERKTKTFLQFMFIIVSGCFIAPFVFGIVKSVLEILMKVGGSATVEESAALLASFTFMFKSYLIISSALTVLGAVQVREGSMAKAVMYIPLGCIATYIIFTVVSSGFLSMLGA